MEINHYSPVCLIDLPRSKNGFILIQNQLNVNLCRLEFPELCQQDDTHGFIDAASVIVSLRVGRVFDTNCINETLV